jgi:hypothetical protein
MWLGGSSDASLAAGEELVRGVSTKQKTALLRYNRRVVVFSAGMPMCPNDNSHYS